jgi:hypothetical protein
MVSTPRRAPESCGNGGAVESLENQEQVSHPFHSSLEISQGRRDFHISTAPAVSVKLKIESTKKNLKAVGKVEIQEQDSHFSTALKACGARKKIIEGKDEAHLGRQTTPNQRFS